MAGGKTEPSESIWTRQINVPPALTRFAVIFYRVFIAIAALLLAVALVLALYQRLTLGPGARLKLTDDVSIRVPAGFSAVEDRGFASHGILKSYVISRSGEDRGGLVAVEALMPGESAKSHDPALLAAYARRMDREVKGPVYFSHAGFDVAAIVEPTVPRSVHEGAYTLVALVDVGGQLVQITGDNLSLGVAEDAEPQTMAEAAIDMLILTAD
ncbi:MAG: hypothetical protein AB2L09_12800 [Coriobacteriia bacterium]